MSKVLYFNRESLAQLNLDEDQHRNQIKDLEEKGWLPNPPLIHMYSPQRLDHKIVHVDDAKLWEERGYFRKPTYVYHPEEGTKLVSEEQARNMYTQGWYDNPGKFPGKKLGTMKVNAPKEAA